MMRELDSFVFILVTPEFTLFYGPLEANPEEPFLWIIPPGTIYHN
jgi:hypothetical protein